MAGHCILSRQPANRSCAWSKSRNIAFHFARNCHGNAATATSHSNSKSSRLVDGFTIIPTAFHGSKQWEEVTAAQQRLAASSLPRTCACTESSHVPAGGTKIREQNFSRSSVIQSSRTSALRRDSRGSQNKHVLRKKKKRTLFFFPASNE